MSAPQPPLTPEQRLALQQKARYESLARTAAIGGIIICPLIAVLPPRKLDMYTFGLGICFYLSADHLSTSYTGRSLIENYSWKMRDVGSALPTERAREFQRMQEERKAREREQRGEGGVADVKKGVLTRIWMGGEKEGWRERRMQEEREKLERGESYTSMILDQIWEVWNWDKKKQEGEGEKKDGPKKS
ncbi:uncharacterized protein BDR25DRAFT_334568 [Lindgomyces ingoldianus]|uniref:Uncharacterized protein n=1 Tax=Lindgomyces ingoldianus TaxID=673940 RepID=A0ACB6QU09_9PLEO|nr:uncharacterized protein BDR25DRAFT_334568 [Lindgomyces ingoldianus]KAF2470063.1 hypothetical protein BDR25DRAFT_334568 [Lindgomyces ingoldianus]